MSGLFVRWSLRFSHFAAVIVGSHCRILALSFLDTVYVQNQSRLEHQHLNKWDGNANNSREHLDSFNNHWRTLNKLDKS